MSLLADDESYGLYNVLLHAARRSLDIPEVTGDAQANLDEIELYADMLTAAAAADGPLTQEEIDAVLGVRPARQQPATARSTRHRPDDGSLVNVYLREVKRVPRLTPAEETGLIEEFRAARAAGQHQGAEEAPGNHPLVAGEASRAKQRLIEANLGLVITAAGYYRGQGLVFLDLIQEGNLGLISATEDFDASRGDSFTIYAVYGIGKRIAAALEGRVQGTRQDAAEQLTVPPGLIEDIASAIPGAARALIQLQYRLAQPAVPLPGRQARILQLYYGLYDGYQRSSGEIASQFATRQPELAAEIPGLLRSLRLPGNTEEELLRRLSGEHPPSPARPGNHSPAASPRRTLPSRRSSLAREFFDSWKSGLSFGSGSQGLRRTPGPALNRIFGRLAGEYLALDR
jgi:RNA polymerase sigma factor (sigma-70 family)